ncbi:hypothetical protein [Nocardia sp. NPDC051981]|uniref:hypothetical protein n=1 Tax=Nocardia sp. NPDC051981 TaxID=3155417 RepID=UPI0034332923
MATETNPTLRKCRKDRQWGVTSGEKVEANVFRVEADSRTGMRGSLQPCPATPNYDTGAATEYDIGTATEYDISTATEYDIGTAEYDTE